MNLKPKNECGAYTMTGNMLDVFEEDGVIYLCDRSNEPRRHWIRLPNPMGLIEVLTKEIKKLNVKT